MKIQAETRKFTVIWKYFEQNVLWMGVWMEGEEKELPIWRTI